MDLPASPRAKTVRISFSVERIQQLLHPEAHLVKALDKAETNAVIEHTQEKENNHL